MRRKFILSGMAVLAGGLSGLALAHHVDLPLSHIQGPDVLSRVPYYLQGSNVGVPAYHVGDQPFDHGHLFSLQPGDSFTVCDEAGTEEVVTFESGDFADIQNVTIEDLLAVIDAKSDLLATSHTNSFTVFRGLDGGEGSWIELIDGHGSPLAKLAQAGGLRNGARDVVLDLSIPADHHGESGHDDLAGHPYVLLMSRTDGDFVVNGQTVPIGFDFFTLLGLFLARFQQAMPGFVGQLDDNEDAQATLLAPIVRGLTRLGDVEEFHFSFVVLSEDLREVEFVSNRFTLDMVR